MKNLLLIISAALILSSSANAQVKRKPLRKKGAATTTANQPQTASAPVDGDAETLTPNRPQKKNERAVETATTQRKNAGDNAAKTAAEMPFVYEFSQPRFLLSKIRIEHDGAGAGRMTFEKQNVTEPVTEQIQVSPRVLEQIKNDYAALNFLDSSEVYQTPDRDYSHLGTMKFRLIRADKRREIEFNWTENKTARDLAAVYEKLTQQFVWIFEMNLARENQPLETTKLTEQLVGLYNRSQLADARQMLPLLHKIIDDERVPLVGRNQIARLVTRIEKQKD